MLSKKYSILISCFMVLLLIMAGCGSNSKDAGSEVNESEDTITLKVATWYTQESYYTTEFFNPFMEKITSLTDGRVQFEYYPGEQLGKAGDSLSMVAKGVVDIAHFSPNYTPSEMPIGANMIGIPGLYETTIQGAQAYHKIAQQSPVLDKEFLNNGVRLVSATLTPLYNIISNKKEIKVPEDLKGFKLRATPGVFTEIFNYLGAVPVSTSASEIYTSYSTGIVDGLHFNYNDFDIFSLREFTKYGTKDLNMGAGLLGLIINEEVYQGLPQDVQEAIMQVGEELGRSMTKYIDDGNTRVSEELLESKEINMHELSKDEKQKWQNFFTEFEQYWLEKQDSEDFNKALEMFKEEIDKLK